MSRQFEKEYTETNDRIHPRQELLQELESKWAAEEAREADEARKVVAFPAWARALSVAAGILLCIGVGMGSVMILSRGRSQMNKTASAEAPMAATEGAMDMAAAEPEEAKILFEAVEEEEAPKTMLAAAAQAPEGTHFAANEAEVEDAILYRTVDLGAAKAAKTQTTAANDAESETVVPAGKIIRRDDVFAVFQPTSDQVHVIEYVGSQVNQIFALTMREKGTQVREIFWLGDEFLAVREQAGETELLRFDVSDWKSPRHLKDLTQSGAFLGAWEMGNRLFILSLYTAAEEEPLPWVDGSRLDFDKVLLDRARPGDAFAVLTVYEPGLGEGFAAETALLATVRGAADTGDGRLLLWTEGEAADLYVLALDADGLMLAAESTQPGTVLDAGPLGEGFTLLLQNGDTAELLNLDAELRETTRTAARTGEVRWGQVYEDGAVILTADSMHFLTKSGDHALGVTGDAFCWLTPDRGLVLNADGQLQVVSVLGTGLETLGAAQVKGGLGPLLDDLDRLTFDIGTGRLVIPAGQRVYQYIVDEAGNLTQRGEVQAFSDHDEAEQREIRAFLLDDRALLFYKAGVMLCNQNINRLQTCKY